LRFGSPDPLDDRHRLGRGVEEIAWNVAVVDGLDDHGQTFTGEPVGRVPQVGDIDALGLGAITRLRPQPGHRMQNPALRRLGVDECGLDPAAELLLAPGQSADAALARGPIAGRHVEESLLEPVPVQLLRNHFRRMVVGREIFDPLEAAGSGGAEAVEKSDFLENEAEVGGEFRHGRSSFAGSERRANTVT